MINLRKPKGRGGIGGPRNPEVPNKKTLIQRYFSDGVGGPTSKIKTTVLTGKNAKAFKKMMKGMRRVGHTHRGEQERCLKLLKKVVIQEYHGAGAESLELLKTCELDHIHGRNKPGFKLGAMLDPANVQLLTPLIHRLKTDEKAVGGPDYRRTIEQERLLALSARLWAKLGPLKFTAKEYRKALRGELYAKH